MTFQRPDIGIEYRKTVSNKDWHWCGNCANWPTKNYNSRRTPPSRHEMCRECLGWTELGNCRN